MTPASPPAGRAEAATADSGSSITIRGATDSDVEAVTNLFLQLKHHHARLAPDQPRYRVSDKRWREVAAKTLANPAAAVFMAEREGRPVGMMILKLEEKPWGLACEIDTLVVDEASRGSGVGAMLLDEAERYARDAGAAGMRVDVLATNEGGRGFYERAGYSLFAVRYGKQIDSSSAPGPRPNKL